MGLAVRGQERGHAADAGCLRLAAYVRKLADPIGRVGGGDRPVRIEPGAIGRTADLRVGRDVLALAEERLVERVLERPQPALSAAQRQAARISVERGW